jgi:hypothetical protein
MFTVTFAPSASAQPKHRDPAVPWEAGGQEAGIWMDKVSALIAEQQYEAAMQAIGNIVNYVNALIAEQQAEAARAADVARAQQQQSAPRVQPSAPAPSGGGAVGACTGFAVPDYIIQRESGGNPNAYNASSGAIGCTQTLISHYNAGGICAGLDPHTVDGQRQCTQRLVNAAGLAPWSTR